jgi:hypothetical protein
MCSWVSLIQSPSRFDFRISQMWDPDRQHIAMVLSASEANISSDWLWQRSIYRSELKGRAAAKIRESTIQTALNRHDISVRSPHLLNMKTRTNTLAVENVRLTSNSRLIRLKGFERDAIQLITILASVWVICTGAFRHCLPLRKAISGLDVIIYGLRY